MSKIDTYKLRYVNNSKTERKGQLIILHRLTFISNKKCKYVIEVEQLNYSFYAIKFYAHKHRFSPNRYRLSTNLGSVRSIIMTCINAMLYFYNINPHASFGFVAETGLDEDVSIKKTTKRFRVYRQLIVNVFSSVTFKHFTKEEKNIYLLINSNNHEDNLIQKITKTLSLLYPSYINK